uniref:hypothetical protein n=1 Tax=Emticicia sp. 17c TaxID=3127704 RepID=UPI00301D1E14
MGTEVVLKEKALYAEGDADNPKKVNIVLGDTPAMIFEFETKELADKMIDWVGGTSPSDNKATFPITGTQLKEIFPSTKQERCDEVAKIINKYS